MPTKKFHIAALSTPAILENLTYIILKRFSSHFFDVFSRKQRHVHENIYECPYYKKAKLKVAKASKCEEKALIHSFK